IRDLTVTGVQTCALPIFAAGKQISRDAGVASRFHIGLLVADQETGRAIDRPVEDQIEQHAGPRLTQVGIPAIAREFGLGVEWTVDRKSTRLNSSHSQISY